MMLIENGADINLSDSNKTTPLMTAIQYNNIDVAILLIKKGCELDTQDNDKETALHFAVQLSTLSLIDFLIKHGANINIKDRNHNTPLILSTKRQEEKIAMLLMDNGADINIKDRYGDTPLIISIKNRYKKIAMMLIDNGADLNAVDPNGDSLLISAIRNNLGDVALNFIKHGYRSDLSPCHDCYPGILCHFLMKAYLDFNKRHQRFLELLFLSGSCTQSRLFMLLKDPLYFSQFEKNPEILHWIESKSCSPMSLKNIARIAILAHIQPNKTKNIEETELPMTLRHFLQFNDIIDNGPIPMITRRISEETSKT
ncbi:hypothetical protein LOTGIDRAFT_176017 [Lottia gigantea]|uniref:Uncharacterized protein n=1 Tax=Lottia gigantea TaxID=225164 RepID=V3Z6A2_LOTGI|nr:hypothetical protein LOTGIDRAFT_176017 [Lottia gigantea]ESO86313.1 hypothetical protein LOTGIDRAFT_176017 [Lottia gigantea]